MGSMLGCLRGETPVSAAAQTHAEQAGCWGRDDKHGGQAVTGTF